MLRHAMLELSFFRSVSHSIYGILSHYFHFHFGFSCMFYIDRFGSQAYQMSSNTLSHGINSVPIVSPRNTSIPHPLPHHIGKNHGKLNQDQYFLTAARQAVEIDMRNSWLEATQSLTVLFNI